MSDDSESQAQTQAPAIIPAAADTPAAVVSPKKKASSKSAGASKRHYVKKQSADAPPQSVDSILRSIIPLLKQLPSRHVSGKSHRHQSKDLSTKRRTVHEREYESESDSDESDYSESDSESSMSDGSESSGEAHHRKSHISAKKGMVKQALDGDKVIAVVKGSKKAKAVSQPLLTPDKLSVWSYGITNQFEPHPIESCVVANTYDRVKGEAYVAKNGKTKHKKTKEFKLDSKSQKIVKGVAVFISYPTTKITTSEDGTKEQKSVILKSCRFLTEPQALELKTLGVKFQDDFVLPSVIKQQRDAARAAASAATAAAATLAAASETPAVAADVPMKVEA